MSAYLCSSLCLTLSPQKPKKLQKATNIFLQIMIQSTLDIEYKLTVLDSYTITFDLHQSI